MAGLLFRNANRQIVIDQNYYNLIFKGKVILNNPVNSGTVISASGSGFATRWRTYDITSFASFTNGLAFSVSLPTTNLSELCAFIRKSGGSTYITLLTDINAVPHTLYAFGIGGSASSGPAFRVFKDNQVVFDSRYKYMKVISMMRGIGNKTPINSGKQYSLLSSAYVGAYYWTGWDEGDRFMYAEDWGVQGIHISNTTSSYSVNMPNNIFDPWSDHLGWFLSSSSLTPDYQIGDGNYGDIYGNPQALILDVTNY